MGLLAKHTFYLHRRAYRYLRHGSAASDSEASLRHSGPVKLH